MTTQKKLTALCLILASLVLSGCATPYSPPVAEMCVITKTKVHCHDPRMKPKSKIKSFEELVGYACTNQADLSKHRDWEVRILEKLEFYEKKYQENEGN